MEINIKDYLSDDEMKEICREVFREKVRAMFSCEKEISRIIINLSYSFVFQAIQENMDEDFVTVLKANILKVLNNKGSINFEVFKRPSEWDNSIGAGYQILQDTIKENEGLIREKVIEAIKDYDYFDRQELQSRMEDVFHDVLEEKLFGGSNATEH